MKDGKRPPRKPDADGGPESVLPGQRSGEGVDDLFQHILRDERRKAGLGKGAPLDRGSESAKKDPQKAADPPTAPDEDAQKK